MPYMDQQSQQADIQTLKALAGQNTPRAADPDQQWAMELEKRAKEAGAQIELHRSALERWQRMSRAVHAALAALHEPQPEPEEYDQAEGPGY